MKMETKAFDHSGSSFESFLEEEGIRAEVEAMARELHTSRSQLDRLLDPQNVSVSLAAIARAAQALGKSLVIRIGDRRTGGTGARRPVARSKQQASMR